MPRVMIVCPETDKPVYTHLNHTWFTLESAFFEDEIVACPYCRQDHAWRREDAYVDEEGGG